MAIDSNYVSNIDMEVIKDDFLIKFYAALNDKTRDNNISLIREISEKCNIASHRIIHYLLMRNPEDIQVLEEIKKYYYSNKIDSNRCLVIADSHIGRLDSSEYRNYKELVPAKYPINFGGFLYNELALYKAYEYAYAKGIKYVIHAGDVIEGDSYENRKRMLLYHQLQYLKQYYPQYDSIKTYCLLGNHDFNAMNHSLSDDDEKYRIRHDVDPIIKVEYKEVFDTINSIKNMDIIGIKQSYVSFPNSLVKVYHESASEYRFISSLDQFIDLEIIGHTHNYNIDNNRLYVPNICTAGSPWNKIGYIELIDEEKEFVVKCFSPYSEIPKENVIKKKYIKKN